MKSFLGHIHPPAAEMRENLSYGQEAAGDAQISHLGWSDTPGDCSAEFPALLRQQIWAPLYSHPAVTQVL